MPALSSRPGAKLCTGDTDGEALVLPSAWMLCLGSGGTTVKFAYSRGTVVLFRQVPLPAQMVGRDVPSRRWMSG